MIPTWLQSQTKIFWLKQQQQITFKRSRHNSPPRNVTAVTEMYRKIYQNTQVIDFTHYARWPDIGGWNCELSFEFYREKSSKISSQRGHPSAIERCIEPRGKWEISSTSGYKVHEESHLTEWINSAKSVWLMRVAISETNSPVIFPWKKERWSAIRGYQVEREW